MGCHGRFERLMAILLGSLSGGMQPTAPTIGTATAGDASASVAFTASSYIGKGTITYTATSSPGGFTGTGSSSPITVSGLTNGTAYTFTVTGTTNYGVSSVASASSNSVTPAVVVTGGFYSITSYTVPSDTGSVVSFTGINQSYKDLVVIIRAGATYAGSGGGSAGKLYLNNDNTANYTYSALGGNGNGTSGGVTAGGTGTTNQFDFGASWAGNANAWLSQVFIFQDYTNTSKRKNMRCITGLYCGNGTNSNTALYTGSYTGTSAISSIQLYHSNGIYGDGNLRAGSQIQIFGIAG
jgi:hypothetical protein